MKIHFRFYIYYIDRWNGKLVRLVGDWKKQLIKSKFSVIFYWKSLILSRFGLTFISRVYNFDCKKYVGRWPHFVTNSIYKFLIFHKNQLTSFVPMNNGLSHSFKERTSICFSTLKYMTKYRSPSEIRTLALTVTHFLSWQYLVLFWHRISLVYLELWILSRWPHTCFV